MNQGQGSSTSGWVCRRWVAIDGAGELKGRGFRTPEGGGGWWLRGCLNDHDGPPSLGLVVVVDERGVAW